MGLKLVPAEDGQLDGAFENMGSAWAGMSADAWWLAFGEWSRTVEALFEAEGDPPWMPLSPMTARIRSELGYGAYHPILRRSGMLFASLTTVSGPMTVTLSGETHRSGSSLHAAKEGRSTHFAFGTHDDRFVDMQMGSEHVPSRPMVPMGAQSVEMCERIEKLLIGALRRPR